MDFLQAEAIELHAKSESAIDAIQLAGDLLVHIKRVQPTYVEAMIKNYTEIGPYIVIAPGIAIPHARPEDGAIKPSLSIVRLTEPISFGHGANDPVMLVCALAGVDESSHLMMLKQIAQVMGNKENLNVLKTTDDTEQIVQLFL